MAYYKQKSNQFRRSDMTTTSVGATSIVPGKVLMIYTGGTIGMKPNEDGVYDNVPGYLHQWLLDNPVFNDPTYVPPASTKRKARADEGLDILYPTMYMPVVSKDPTQYIPYDMLEYGTLLDSSNMTTDVMLQMAADIGTYYTSYDAFVIIHGTDTMCYTASGLSFVLENLGKTVIITGSQIPIYETRTDGVDNLSGALLMASAYSSKIPEVCIFFDKLLLRGNRSTKISADTLDAYESPNLPVLGTLEVNITLDEFLILPTPVGLFHAYDQLSNNISVVRVFPDLSPVILTAALADPVQGVVLQCYGTGTFPSNNPELLAAIKAATDRGVVVVDVTQVLKGAVSISYATAESLVEAGVITGGDMTTEAALMKLSYLLTKGYDQETIESNMQEDLMGELSTEPETAALSLSGTLSSIGIEPANVTKTVGNIADLKKSILLPLVNMTIKQGNTKMLDKICATQPGSLKITDSDGRTALHLAAREGSFPIVQQLLKRGASVHCKDRWGRSPLLEAIFGKKMNVIGLMVKSGAHLTMEPNDLAMELNKAASREDLVLLKAFGAAGTKMDVSDYSSRTPLHMAVLKGSAKCVEYLLSSGSDPLAKDDAGKTAEELTSDAALLSIFSSKK